MDRKSLLQLFAAGSLMLGVILFLAIPTESETTHHPGTPGFANLPGLPASDSTFTCDMFDRGDLCGPRFWLRAGAFGVGAFGAIVLLFLAFQPSAGTLGPVIKSSAASDLGFRSPPVGLPKPKPETDPAVRVCPDCAEEVRAAARKCRFCGYIFESLPTPQV